jgi:hypothetical protein
VNAFSVVLFIHVLSAIALFIGIAFEGAILTRLRSAQDLEQLGCSVRASRRLGAIYGPAFLGILLGGIYLAAQLHIRSAWVPLALGATLLMGIVAGAVTGRNTSRLRKALEQNGSSFESLVGFARGNALVISYGFRAGLAVGIVFLMSAMPALVPSVLALIIGSTLGIVLSFSLRRVSGFGRVWKSTQTQPVVRS